MTLRRWLVAGCFAALGIGIAWAADNNFPTPGGATAPGAVQMCLNSSNQAVACGASGAIGNNVNVSQINGVTPLMGNGVTGTGSPRVTIASDSSGLITTGTFGSASSTVLSVQGGASMTPVRQFPVPTALSEGAITPVTVSSGQTLVLKNTAGNLYGVYATNLTASAGFLVLGNVASAPADGAVTPIECIPIAANGNASINYNGAPPAAFSTGITAWLSSASVCTTKTTSGALAGFIKGMVQ